MNIKIMYTQKEVENLLKAQIIKTEQQSYQNFKAESAQKLCVLELVKIPTKKLKQNIKDWKILTNQITRSWIKTYFELDEEDCEEGVEYYWVADDVGSIFEFADYYVNFSDVLDCYKHNITVHQYHNWYSYCLDNEFINISLAKFILSPKERKEQEEKELQRCKENVEFAKKELEKAMNNYENN